MSNKLELFNESLKKKNIMCFLSYTESRFKKGNEKHAVRQQLGAGSRDGRKEKETKVGVKGEHYQSTFCTPVKYCNEIHDSE